MKYTGRYVAVISNASEVLVEQLCDTAVEAARWSIDHVAYWEAQELGPIHLEVLDADAFEERYL